VGLVRAASIPAVTRLLATLAAAVLLAGCVSSSGTPPASSGTPTASPAPRLPDGLPPSFDQAFAADNVPAAALIPLGATVTGSWATSTSAGEAIVVAWAFPGKDPLRQDRGVAAWRRFDDGGAPWRPVWGVAFPAGRDQPVLGVDAQTADVTGDGSADALVSASLGGSGACAATTVIDLAADAEVYRSRGCDRTIEPSSDPVGLLVREAVYSPGDPHCCPSGVRETVLVYENGAWQTATSSVSPT
jgi:hypothetical protein